MKMEAIKKLNGQQQEVQRNMDYCRGWNDAMMKRTQRAVPSIAYLMGYRDAKGVK